VRGHAYSASSESLCAFRSTVVILRDARHFPRNNRVRAWASSQGNGHTRTESDVSGWIKCRGLEHKYTVTKKRCPSKAPNAQQAQTKLEQPSKGHCSESQLAYRQSGSEEHPRFGGEGVLLEVCGVGEVGGSRV